jgi:hypothetical protein
MQKWFSLLIPRVGRIHSLRWSGAQQRHHNTKSALFALRVQWFSR